MVERARRALAAARQQEKARQRHTSGATLGVTCFGLGLGFGFGFGLG